MIDSKYSALPLESMPPLSAPEAVAAVRVRVQEWYDSAVRFDLIKEIARDTEICIVIRKTGYLRLRLPSP